MNKSNFDFLKGVNDFIYAIACAAENNYPDDPNTTLIKMRMFGEATAKHLGQLLDIPACENQHDLLRELGKIAFIDDSILSVFHKLRRIGNPPTTNFITIWTMPRCACGSGSASASGTTGW